jgi:hypothetical protein
MCEIVTVNIVCLVLSFVLHKHEPLKSRGIIPQFALSILLIANCVRLASIFTPLDVTYGLVPVQVFALTIVWGTIIMIYIRYMVKQHLERVKITQTNTTVNTAQRIHFMFVSNTGMVIYFLVLCFCMGIVAMGLWLSLFVTQVFLMASVVINIVFSAIEIGLSLVLIGVDLVVDIVRHGWFTGAYTLRDPLNYRVDGIFLLVCCLSSACYVAIIQVAYTIIARTGYITESYNGLIATTVICEHIERWCLISLSGGSCIILIIKREITKRIVKPTSQEAELTYPELLHKIWYNPDGKRAIENYSQAEFSIENCFAYEAIAKYKETKDNEEKLKMASLIYTTYIDGNGSLQVNISVHCKKSVAENIERAKSDVGILECLFNEFEAEVRGNLLDTFSRFVFSEHYSKYRKGRSSLDRYVYNKA